MPSYRNNPNYQPRQDTGWGLIFRLNLLFGKIEEDVDRDDLDSWNKHIDAIYRNILYKQKEEIVKDENGKIKDVRFNQADVEIFSKFAQQIDVIKKEMHSIRGNNPYVEPDIESGNQLFALKMKFYNIVFKKDIWIRKKMYQLDLYLKQAEHDPRKAIYGG